MVQADDQAADYGESDIEAKAMEQASGQPQRRRVQPRSPVAEPVQASGSTETDVAKNVRDKRRRASKN